MQFKEDYNGQFYMEDVEIPNTILYSNGCPRCNILKTKLDNEGISYVVCTNVDEMVAMGFETAPMLSVNGNLLDFGQAVRWINNMKEV